MLLPHSLLSHISRLVYDSAKEFKREMARTSLVCLRCLPACMMTLCETMEKSSVEIYCLGENFSKNYHSGFYCTLFIAPTPNRLYCPGIKCISFFLEGISTYCRPFFSLAPLCPSFALSCTHTDALAGRLPESTPVDRSEFFWELPWRQVESCETRSFFCAEESKFRHDTTWRSGE
jgi:hypothetical protein